jgi:hypothetical protein
MTLPASGAISLNNVNVELGLSGTASINMGSAAVRGLFGVASGAISMSDGYGKSNETLVYIARVTSVADEIASFPDAVNFMSGTWNHEGGSADGGTINISGSGTYRLYSISMGKRIAASGSVPTITMRVYSG